MVRKIFSQQPRIRAKQPLQPEHRMTSMLNCRGTVKSKCKIKAKKKCVTDEERQNAGLSAEAQKCQEGSRPLVTAKRQSRAQSDKRHAAITMRSWHYNAKHARFQSTYVQRLKRKPFVGTDRRTTSLSMASAMKVEAAISDTP